MQHVRIIHPPCYFGQEPIMSDIVKVAAQVDVYDTCFPLTNCSGHPVDCFMRCPFGTISKRSRLEIRLEDRLQYELERPLHLSLIHISEPTRLGMISYAVFCLKKKT